VEPEPKFQTPASAPTIYKFLDPAPTIKIA